MTLILLRKSMMLLITQTILRTWILLAEEKNASLVSSKRTNLTQDEEKNRTTQNGAKDDGFEQRQNPSIFPHKNFFSKVVFVFLFFVLFYMVPFWKAALFFFCFPNSSFVLFFLFSPIKNLSFHPKTIPLRQSHCFVNKLQNLYFSKI